MPKVVNHAQYRKELLAKSFDCFADKGYAAMTMRELAKNLGVSTGTLYHYFPSKQAMFEALVEYMADRELLLASALEEQPGSLEERIEALIALGVEYQEYLMKETVIWIDIFRHHGRENVISNPAVVRTCDRYRQWISNYFGTNNQDVLAFVSSYLNGLVLEMVFEFYRVSVPEQSKLLAATVRESLKNQAG